MLPMHLGQTPVLTTGCGSADQLGYRIRYRLLWPPQLHQARETFITQAKLRWGCNNWDHTNPTAAPWLSVSETLVFPFRIDALMGWALLSKTLTNPLSCSRPRWKQNLPSLSQLICSKAIQEKVVTIKSSFKKLDSYGLVFGSDQILAVLLFEAKTWKWEFGSISANSPSPELTHWTAHNIWNSWPRFGERWEKTSVRECAVRNTIRDCPLPIQNGMP